MYALHIHHDAAKDLRQLRLTDLDAFGRITAILQEIKASQYLLDCLTARDFGYDKSETFHVTEIASLRRAGNFWRLKIWEIKGYRVIYCYIPGERAYYVLGIMERGINYETDHPFMQRVIDAYRNL